MSIFQARSKENVRKHSKSNKSSEREAKDAEKRSSRSEFKQSKIIRKMCILDFLSNGSTSKSLSAKYQRFIMSRSKPKSVIYFNENISMVEKGKAMNLLSSFMVDRKKEFEAKTATCDFSSDDRERSSTDEDDKDGYRSACTMCTSSFSFCNASDQSLR